VKDALTTWFDSNLKIFVSTVASVYNLCGKTLKPRIRISKSSFQTDNFLEENVKNFDIKLNGFLRWYQRYCRNILPYLLKGYAM